MDKVKITREQAEALEIGLSMRSGTDLIKRHVSHNVGGSWLGRLKPMNELGDVDLVRAVREGYEVEDRFEVGDWYYDETTKKIAELTSESFTDWLNEEKLSIVRRAFPEEIAEEKQRSWWMNQGRDVGEYKVGDLLKSKKYGTFGEVTYSSDRLHGISLNKAKYRYTDLLEYFNIACFVEDRKDLEY